MHEFQQNNQKLLFCSHFMRYFPQIFPVVSSTYKFSFHFFFFTLIKLERTRAPLQAKKLSEVNTVFNSPSFEKLNLDLKFFSIVAVLAIGIIDTQQNRKLASYVDDKFPLSVVAREFISKLNDLSNNKMQK